MPVQNFADGNILTAGSLLTNLNNLYAINVNNTLNYIQQHGSAFTTNFTFDNFTDASYIATGLGVNTGSNSSGPAFLPLVHRFDPFSDSAINTTVWESGLGGAGGTHTITQTGSLVMLRAAVNNIGAGSTIMAAWKASAWNFKNGSDWHLQIPFYWYHERQNVGSAVFTITLHPSGVTSAGSQILWRQAYTGSIKVTTGSTTLDVYLWKTSGALFTYTGGALLGSWVDISALGSWFLRIQMDTTFDNVASAGSSMWTFSEVRGCMQGSLTYTSKALVGSNAQMVYYANFISGQQQPLQVMAPGSKFPINSVTYRLSASSGTSFDTVQNKEINTLSSAGSYYVNQILVYNGSLMPGSNYAGWNNYGWGVYT